MNIDALLAPISTEHPCGENLEYDADFMAMDKATVGKNEQQFGDTIIPAQAPDWREVERLASALLTRTKDLRVMLALTQAWTQLRGLTGYADGLSLIKQAVLLYWPSLLPALEFEGEYDPLLRISALAALGDQSTLTAAVRQAPLLKNTAGEIALRDACALLDGSKPECDTYPGGRHRLLDELAQGQQPGIEALLRITDSLETLQETLRSYLGEDALPEMSQLLKTLSVVAHACQPASIPTQSPPAANEEHTQVTPAATHGTAPPAVSVLDWRSAQIQSREDAQLMLSKITHYFRQHEPSHPAPLMLDRVQRLLMLDFMDIVRDLAPDSLHHLETIFGRTDQ